MRILLGLLLLLGGLVGRAGAAGVSFGTGAIGVCGLEQTVNDGVTIGIIVMDNVATDDDVIAVDQLRVTINHFDGDEVRENILSSPDGLPPRVLISPHSEFQWTYDLRPMPDDLFLPDQILTIRVEAFGNVLFNAAKVGIQNAIPSARIMFASFGDITHVLAANPPLCH